ncbi:MAG: AAA family ATPase [Spirochaetaceae bacterium]|jgi:ABC-type lipoprotein export system ATPase subunit|nr:AAA family ATPase [Spirochaetaceae bacterium]
MKELFVHGAAWLRADFHLHTKADREFSYSGDDDYYLSSYVEALKAAGIAVGLVTNHNKFDFKEFKALRESAKKQGIFLIPGVELSVNDGANGIHVLIAFSDSWIENGQDRVSPFLTTMFPGKTPTEYQNENGRSDKNILQMVEELKKIEKDYFLIFAHVEDSKGLWKEMNGGKLSDWNTGRYAEVRRHTLGFQKVRTRDDRDKVKQWLGGWYPAEVEGSDPKSIEEVGKCRDCCIKLGALTFEAVKFALLDHENRVSAQLPKVSHSHIRNAEFIGGILDGKRISFSPELNTLIGIRGSGKSAVLEMLRYALNIPFGENAGDQKYKSELVRYALGSGGKIVLHAANRFGQSYRIERILNESPVVYIDDKILPGVSGGGTVIHKPLYFGQKDLSSSSDGFERDLVEKLVAEKLIDVRRRIAAQQESVRQSAVQFLNIGTAAERIDELNTEKQDIAHRLAVFAQHGIEARLQKRLDFDADILFAQNAVSGANNAVRGLEDFLENSALPALGGYVSKHNQELLNKFIAEYEKAKSGFGKVNEQLPHIKNSIAAMEALLQELSRSKLDLADEFAEIERNLAQELAADDLRVSSDEFLKLKQRQAQVEQELSLLSKSKERNANARGFLRTLLAELGELRHEEFLLIQRELDIVGKHSGALRLFCEYKGDKAEFLDFTKSMFRGSGIRESTLKGIIDRYTDFAALFEDYAEAEKSGLLGNNPKLFTDWFNRSLAEFITFQVPNRFVIKYHEKELKQHSLGQRASALILFVLSQKDNDLIIIDQPEDDLDNQTIYEDVIKLIRELKPNVQFILATHNPNVPVLGDAEQVLACSLAENAVNIQSGGIDDPQQQRIIVDIMEGGREAFNKRKEIYQSWNS